ncbi:LysR family transcriptional regulator [Roseibacterium sp. SDUM158016]|jgi:DNA-binding transcriptional LysR family regulator|uniref:LysR family transcriptional regulator n=1 Tax=Roseicyclus sediminis TaxID=2980997 RepID=UPI0021CF0219|nr:LysR family transcriptional regulator [Roseibacterium sp. SDUM158016]MCU4651269.1 LysR family transcriptional regulator [Roseibacterium sp. SDUM158016]
MDWKSLTFDWNRARAVAATAETGSLSAAARALGLTQPTLGRQVTALEEELGVTLFTRAGKRMELTEAGLSLIDHLRTMAEAAHAAALAATGQSQEIAGAVTITASNLYASELLPPILGRIREEAPALQIQVVASNALSDLMRREADIAIRHVRPDQPDLTAKLVAEDEAALYATPDLLARGELTALPFIGYLIGDQYRSMLAERGVDVPAENFAFFSEDSHTQRAIARAGLGVAVLPTWAGDPDPVLVRAQPEAPPLVRFPIWLAAHRDLHTSRRVRLVFDHLAEGFSRIGRGSQGRRDTVHPE